MWRWSVWRRPTRPAIRSVTAALWSCGSVTLVCFRTPKSRVVWLRETEEKFIYSLFVHFVRNQNSRVCKNLLMFYLSSVFYFGVACFILPFLSLPPRTSNTPLPTMLYSSCSLITNWKRQSAVALFCHWEKNKTSSQSVSVLFVFLSVLSTRSPKVLAYRFPFRWSHSCSVSVFSLSVVIVWKETDSCLLDCLRRAPPSVPCQEHGRKQNVSAEKKASKRRKTLKKKD